MGISNAQDNLDQLMQLLQGQNKGAESLMLMLLVSQMREMNANYMAVLQELQEIKSQMNNQQSTSHVSGYSSLIVDQVEVFEGDIKDQYHQFQGMAQKLNEKAGILIQKFKDVGIKALNNVCEFLNIKEILIKLRDKAQSNAVKMEGYIEKIDAIEKETGEIASHLKNIRDVVTDNTDKPFSQQERVPLDKAPQEHGANKETYSVPAVLEAQNPAENTQPISEKRPSIFEKLKKHFQRNLKKFSDRVDKLNKAIEKINKLEHEADRASARTDKASVKEKLENNRALIEAKESSEPKQVREKHQEEMTL